MAQVEEKEEKFGDIVNFLMTKGFTLRRNYGSFATLVSEPDVVIDVIMREYHIEIKTYIDGLWTFSFVVESVDEIIKALNIICKLK